MMKEFNSRSYVLTQLAYAEEQLLLADDMSSKVTWGNRCDALEAALADMEAA
jgi:hypothetical protein